MGATLVKKTQEREIRTLIEENRAVVDFAEFGDGVSEDWCLRAEHAMDVSLPPSFRWWLMHYRGGEVLGEEIYSIYEQDFDGVVGGDVVSQYRVSRTSGVLAVKQVPICYSDLDGLFYLDTTRVDAEGESPVVSAITGNDYADDFLEFLAKRISLARRS